MHTPHLTLFAVPWCPGARPGQPGLLTTVLVLLPRVPKSPWKPGELLRHLKGQGRWCCTLRLQTPDSGGHCTCLCGGCGHSLVHTVHTACCHLTLLPLTYQPPPAESVPSSLRELKFLPDAPRTVDWLPVSRTGTHSILQIVVPPWRGLSTFVDSGTQKSEVMICEYEHAHVMVSQWRSEDNFWGSVFSFYLFEMRLSCFCEAVDSRIAMLESF